MAIRLGVNIDHVATLRAARGTAYPDPVQAAHICAEAGATGITAHLREDRRHIQDADIYNLKAAELPPLNLEMANTAPIVEIALEVKPKEVCFVPEKREELTTEGGLNVPAQVESLGAVISTMKAAGIEASLFVDPDKRVLEACLACGAPVVELHTGAYCDASPERKPYLMEELVCAAEFAHSLGLKVNAGHGINMATIAGILQIPHLDTLNIGHSIVSRAVFVGIHQAVSEMLEAMRSYGSVKS